MRRKNLTLSWLGGVFLGDSLSWLDGSEVDFLAWLPGQPDSQQRGDCVGLGLTSDTSPAWDDLRCRQYLGTSCVCKKHDNQRKVVKYQNFEN